MHCIRRAASRRTLQHARSLGSTARVLGLAARASAQPTISQAYAPLMRRFASSATTSESTADSTSQSSTSGSSPLSETTVGSIVDAAAEKAHEAKETVTSALSDLSPRGNKKSKTLFLGNLYFGVTAEKLKEECSQLGEVVDARIIEDDRGLSRGFGFVEFADEQTAVKAAESLQGRYLEGRQVSVDFAKRSVRSARKPMGPTQTLFIGNIPAEMTDKDISDIFRDVDNVTDIRVAVDRRTGQIRGFVHADFVTVDDSIKAKEILTGKTYYGSELRIDFGVFRPQNNPYTRPESK